MDFSWLIPLLALITILAVLIFALYSKRRTEEDRKANTQASSLAVDGDDHVVKD